MYILFGLFDTKIVYIMYSEIPKAIVQYKINQEPRQFTNTCKHIVSTVE